MEVVPVVTQILYYTIGLLVVSLIANFVIHKLKKESDIKTEPTEVRKLSEKEIAEKLNKKKPITIKKKKEKSEDIVVEKKAINPNHFHKRLEDYQKQSSHYVNRKRKSDSNQEREYEDVNSIGDKVLDFRTEFR